MRQGHGKEHLDTLNAHYGPHDVIAPESLKAQYPLLVISVRADERLCTLSTREIMMLLINPWRMRDEDYGSQLCLCMCVCLLPHC